jgi:hypothetical protein
MAAPTIRSSPTLIWMRPPPSARATSSSSTPRTLIDSTHFTTLFGGTDSSQPRHNEMTFQRPHHEVHGFRDDKPNEFV